MRPRAARVRAMIGTGSLIEVPHDLDDAGVEGPRPQSCWAEGQASLPVVDQDVSTDHDRKDVLDG